MSTGLISRSSTRCTCLIVGPVKYLPLAAATATVSGAQILALDDNPTIHEGKVSGSCMTLPKFEDETSFGKSRVQVRIAALTLCAASDTFLINGAYLHHRCPRLPGTYYS
jgi:hypothetical protein